MLLFIVSSVDLVGELVITVLDIEAVGRGEETRNEWRDDDARFASNKRSVSS